MTAEPRGHGEGAEHLFIHGFRVGAVSGSKLLAEISHLITFRVETALVSHRRYNEGLDVGSHTRKSGSLPFWSSQL